MHVKSSGGCTMLVYFKRLFLIISCLFFIPHNSVYAWDWSFEGMKNTVSSYYNTVDKIMLGKIAVLTTVVAGSVYLFLRKSHCNGSTNNIQKKSDQPKNKKKFASKKISEWFEKKLDWYRMDQIFDNELRSKTIKQDIRKMRNNENEQFTEIWNKAVEEYHRLDSLKDKWSKKEKKAYEELKNFMKFDRLRRS